MHKDSIREIVERYLNGTCTDEERQLLHLWFAKESERSDWKWLNDTEKEKVKFALQSRISNTIEIPRRKKVSPYQMYRKQIAVAASLILVLGLGAYSLYRADTSSSSLLPAIFSAHTEQQETDILDEISIRMSDGKWISIDSISGSGLQKVDGFAFVKLSKDELLFEAGENDGHLNDKSVADIRVPRGRDFKVTLCDGTKVWLNAESNLLLPIGFNKRERVISLHGEGFFEVARNESKPFHVKAKDTDIAVLGTSFNVNAYDEDRRVITTLSKGSVAVSTKTDKMLLAADQQAISFVGNPVMQFRQVRSEDVSAWKNGYFVFNQEDIYGIMKMVARWYNVEVYYQGQISSEKFGGTFAKTKTIDELLSYLESLGNFHFKQKGRRLIVTP